MPNRLANETSPYLLQHAHNPVDWYPWGPEALERAKREDKPIFLSIGYAACHWCHVMERESFEDADTAGDLNRDFVAVKVDREERPDLDQVYMSAVQAMTGQGGWPMSVFLTPDGQPFYGGTYFPPRPAHGMPAFRQVLSGIARAWREERLEIVASAGRMVQALVERAAPAGGSGRAHARAPRHRDRRDRAPVRRSQRRLGLGAEVPPADDDRATSSGARPRPAIRVRSPSRGGASTRWPTAGSTTSSAGASTATRPTRSGWSRTSSRCSTTTPSSPGPTSTPGRRRATTGIATSPTGTLDYLLRELRRDDGTFAASQDADTEGVEGATFVWTAAEMRDVLGDDAPAFSAAYDVTDDGNWEGPDDPATGHAARRCGSRGPARRRPGPTPRAAPDAAPTGPRRQGARGVERPRDRGARGRGTHMGRAAVCRRGGRGG